MTRPAATASPWPGRRLVLAVVGVVGLGAVALGSAWALRGAFDRGPAPLCSALSTPVVDLDGFGWSNGFTASGSEWVSVLGSGVVDAADGERDAIARAVSADTEGYARLRDRLPSTVVPAADRLHALLLDPDAAAARHADTEVVRDARAIESLGLEECGLA